MATYLYCPKLSGGALELAKSLGIQRLRRFDGKDFWNKKSRFRLHDGDVIICWGATIPELDGVRVLNGRENPMDKYKELDKLSHNVPVVQVIPFSAKYLKYPEQYIGRLRNHQGGHDLLFGTKQPDYFVTKERFTNEYRIHSFAGKSIRAGIKIPRDGFKPIDDESKWKPGLVHPWIRSFDGGWRINYDNFQSNAKLRKLAHLAVKTVGLTFGAVDIGERQDGKGYMVLEVNTMPGIEGGSVAAYTRAINKWITGAKDDPTEKEQD